MQLMQKIKLSFKREKYKKSNEKKNNEEKYQ